MDFGVDDIAIAWCTATLTALRYSGEFARFDLRDIGIALISTTRKQNAFAVMKITPIEFLHIYITNRYETTFRTQCPIR